MKEIGRVKKGRENDYRVLRAAAIDYLERVLSLLNSRGKQIEGLIERIEQLPQAASRPWDIQEAVRQVTYREHSTAFSVGITEDVWKTMMKSIQDNLDHAAHMAIAADELVESVCEEE